MAKKKRDNLTFSIYLITNKINGMMYVGQTTDFLEQRISQHKSDAKTGKKKTYLYNAINFYEFENFYIDQIDSTKDKNYLNVLEIYWISKLNSLYPNGYNLTTGGKNHNLCDDSKGKIGNIHRGKKLSNQHVLVLQNKMRIKTSLSKTGYKGVERTKFGRFSARLKIGDKRISLGNYKSAIEAAQAYNDGITKYWGSGNWYYNDIYMG